jgi:hypothetical protein
MFWQWLDIAGVQQDPPLTRVEKRYYDTTIFILGIALVSLWYVLPYRFIVHASGQEAIPVFKTPQESRMFLDNTRDWIENEANWHWFSFPIILVSLPYARLVVRTPPFVRSRPSAEAKLRAAQRGLAHGLYRLSLSIQALVSRATDSIGQFALFVNRTLAGAVETSINLALNLADVLFRFSALFAISLIGLVFLIPGLLTGNLLLVIIGLVILIAIAAIMLSEVVQSSSKGRD